eukprot:jgi/Botrbrau1/1070/Bobra.0076s0035.2
MYAGSITIRLQRSVDDPFNFLDIKAAVQGSGSAQLRGCYFDGRTGVGTFAVLPIVSPDADADVAVQMGLRYNSPDASAGIILDPTKDQLHTLWAVGRYGSLTAGVQTSPQVTLGHVLSQATLQKGLENPRETLAAAWREAAPRTSFALAYSPSSGFASGKFTAALEVQEQRQLLISFLQHMAVQRRVRNPWEDENVVGIVNYVNIGLQVEVPMGTKGEGGPSRLVGAASWQANKNWLVKARAGTESVSAAIAFKAWWQPSFSVAAAASWAFRDRLPRFGLSFSLENYGDLRYERSSGQLQGGALVQRHVAQPEDLMNKEGKGVLVLEEDFDNPEILGQKPQVSEKYL